LAGSRERLTDLALEEFGALAELPGARSFHPSIVRRWVFERGASEVGQMSDLPKQFRTELANRYDVRGSAVTVRAHSRDGTDKLLLRLADGNAIEAVLIPEGQRTTLCMSTQVGCGVRCGFCATGIGGVVRSLTPGEMVEQFLFAREHLEKNNRRLTNIVVMGGGEPLNNFDNLKTALHSINARDGAAFGARRITVSTIGIPRKIDRLDELGKQINLAVSLHAPNEELRGQLIPGLDRVPLADVMSAARRYFDRTGREITFEYVVLGGVNDSEACARQLVQLLRGMRGKVNLIPWNRVADLPFNEPSPSAVEAMRSVLDHGAIKVTVRRPRGVDIDAACGQLRRRQG